MEGGKDMFLGRVFLFLTVVCLLLGSPVFAEGGLDEKVSELEARVQALENKLAECDKCIREQNTCITQQKQKIDSYESKLADFDQQLHRQVGVPAIEKAGFSVGAGATIVVQGTNNTNATEKKKEDKADASYSADIMITKEFEEINGKAFAHLETGQGLGLENELTLYSNVNKDANNDISVRISELLYEQGLFDDKAMVTFGKLDPTAYFDNNEAANDETTQFLGKIFRNSPTLEFPDNTAGIRLAWEPQEIIELSYGAFDADSDWERIFDSLFNIGQIAFKPKFFDLKGNYRFYGWCNNAYHTKWLDTSKKKEGAYGFGLSFDQKVNEIITLFTRYGWQDPKVHNPSVTTTAGSLEYSLEHSWSAGLQIDGSHWGRKEDILAFAVGEAIPSDNYKKASSTLRAKNEGHFETYYNMHLNDHLSISPDFQYIWNPFGKDVTDDTDSIFVYGMRAQIDF